MLHAWNALQPRVSRVGTLSFSALLSTRPAYALICSAKNGSVAASKPKAEDDTRVSYYGGSVSGSNAAPESDDQLPGMPTKPAVLNSAALSIPRTSSFRAAVDAKKRLICPSTTHPIFRYGSTQWVISGHHVEEFSQEEEDPGRTYTVDTEAVPDSRHMTTVYVDCVPTLGLTPMPFPSSPSMLHQHLVYLLSRRTESPPSLKSLIAYHGQFDYSLSLRSTRSYNLLIRLALRHASFTTAKKLMWQMRREGINSDLETWKLGVRWLIRTGRWALAWEQVMRTMRRASSERLPIEEGSTKGMPLAVWTEFLRAKSWPAFRARGQGRYHGRRMPVASPHVPSGIKWARFRMLMRNFASLTAQEVRRGPSVRVVHLIVWTMLEVGLHERAMDLTRWFLVRYPGTGTRAEDKLVRKYVDLIHLHLVFRSPKWGVKAHYAALRVYEELQALHPALRPNSKTTMLLLVGLKRAKSCATVGWKFLSRFRKKWGDCVVDSRVRRRIASFALKEGRQDILEQVLAMERITRRARALWMKERSVRGGPMQYLKPIKGKWLLPPDVRVFTRKGKEAQRWRVLRKRVRRVRSAWRRKSET